VHAKACGRGFDEITDLVAQEGEVRIRERGHEEFADAVGRGALEDGRVVARKHRAVMFDEQVAGLAGAVEIDDGHAEDALHDGAMDDAGVFVAGQDEA